MWRHDLYVHDFRARSLRAYTGKHARCIESIYGTFGNDVRCRCDVVNRCSGSHQLTPWLSWRRFVAVAPVGCPTCVDVQTRCQPIRIPRVFTGMVSFHLYRCHHVVWCGAIEMYRKHSGQQPAYSMHMYLEDIRIRDGRIQQNGSIGSHTKVSSCHRYAIEGSIYSWGYQSYAEWWNLRC